MNRPPDTSPDTQAIKLSITQPVDGYRYGVDSLVLAHEILHQLGPARRALEVGAGCGVISLITASLAGRRGAPELSIQSVELQESLHSFAQSNLTANSSQLSCELQFIHQRFQDFAAEATAAGFDLIYSNPPFYATHIGRHNVNDSVNIARREVALTMSELLGGSSRLLLRGGRLMLTYPVTRLQELLITAPHHDLTLRRLTFIHSFLTHTAHSFIADLTAHVRALPQCGPPLIIFDAPGSHNIWLQPYVDMIKGMT